MLRASTAPSRLTLTQGAAGRRGSEQSGGSSGSGRGCARLQPSSPLSSVRRGSAASSGRAGWPGSPLATALSMGTIRSKIGIQVLEAIQREVELDVRLPEGHVASIIFGRDWMVRDLKKEVERLLDIPVQEQRFLLDDCEVQDCDSVAALKAACGLAEEAAQREVCLERRDRECAAWLYKVTRDGLQLRHAPEAIRARREVVRAAVEQNGQALEFASDALRTDRRLVFAAVRCDGLALEHADDALRCDTTLVALALKRCGGALRYAGGRARRDEGLVRAAVEQDYRALHHAAAVLQSNPALVLAAARSRLRELSASGE